MSGLFIFMAIINWKLALIVMLVIPILIVVAVQFKKKILVEYRLVRKMNSKITGAFNENIIGVRVTKALVREEQNLGEFQVLSTSMFRHSVRNALQAAVYLPIVLTLGSVGVGQLGRARPAPSQRATR